MMQAWPSPHSQGALQAESSTRDDGNWGDWRERANSWAAKNRDQYDEGTSIGVAPMLNFEGWRRGLEA
jgi:hypothetical protein